MKASRIVWLSFGFVFFASLAAQADRYIWNDRDDRTVPAHCRDFEIERFATVEKTVFFGIQGAKSQGFTHEVNLERGEARQIWDSVKPGGQKINTGDRDLLELERLVRDQGKEMGFDFKKEGDVLEVLALNALESEYSEKRYFVTGGLSYHKEHQGKLETLGELDIVVARRDDCAVVAIGESKLGTGQLKKAQEQMARFKNYARERICSKKGHDRSSAPLCFL